MIGLRSEYIHPVDSLHGGLNKIKKDDIIFIVSKSGKTKELIDFVSCTKDLCDEYHVLTSSSINNTLLKVCDYTIVLPFECVQDEHHIPSMSYLASSAVVDMLVYGICTVLSVKKENIVKSHPAGNLE
jgi:arabinose-5-phosphate isomerase